MEENGGTKNILSLIDDLRARGVLYFKQGDLEINLGPLPEKDEPAVDNPAKTGKRGKDGLTADQQLETYGRVMDAEE